MSRHHETYRVYRTLLHLYPKSHRAAYGDQMLQTLDDLLSDQHSAYGRIAVWLRVAYELPINVIEENLNSMGEISVNKLTKISNRQLWYGIFALLLIGSYVTVGIVWGHQRARINALDSQLQTVSKNQFAMYGGSFTDVTISPSENAVYLPLARLKLSASVANEKLAYSYTDAYTVPGSKKDFPAQLDISTHDLSVNNYTKSQFSCSQVVYADFVTSSYPLNPQWKSDGTVKLADGRTMNIYYAPSIPGCKDAWAMSKIDSKAIADSLKQAVSY